MQKGYDEMRFLNRIIMVSVIGLSLSAAGCAMLREQYVTFQYEPYIKRPQLSSIEGRAEISAW